MKDMFAGKDEIFEGFLKRHSDRRDKPVPRELYEVVVFYYRPAVDELNFENEEKAQEILKKTKFLLRGQTKFALSHIREISEQLLNNQRFVFPFYSENVFMSAREAETYIPQFVKKLIATGKIPDEAIKDNHINYDVIETGIVTLNLAILEREDEFKSELKNLKI